MNSKIKNNTPKLLAASLLFAGSALCADTASVTPVFETRSHFDDAAGHYTDTDDPAIWIHPTDKQRSFVAATLKEGGMDVYDLKGKLLQHISPEPAPACAANQKHCADNSAGRLNNADLVYNFKLGAKAVDLIVVSDRGLDKIVVYKVNGDDPRQPPLTNITASDQAFIFAANQDEVNEGDTAYGLATVKLDKTYAFVSQNSTTRVAQLELYDNGRGQVAYRSVRNLDFPSRFPLPDKKTWTPCSDDDRDRPQFEGMVADIKHNALYLAQENVGVWRISLSEPGDRDDWKLFAKVNDFGVPYTRTWVESEEEYECKLNKAGDKGFGNAELYPDAEGLTIYEAGDSEGYLLVSSQGNNTVALYDRENQNRYVGSFTVTGADIDGVQETDGMMVVNVDLGKDFAKGLLVMHDGRNDPQVFGDNGAPRVGSNFKYISWEDVAKKLKLKTDTTDRTRVSEYINRE